MQHIIKYCLSQNFRVSFNFLINVHVSVKRDSFYPLGISTFVNQHYVIINYPGILQTTSTTCPTCFVVCLFVFFYFLICLFSFFPLQEGNVFSLFTTGETGYTSQVPSPFARLWSQVLSREGIPLSGPMSLL